MPVNKRQTANILKAADTVRARALLKAASLVATGGVVLERLAVVETKVEGLMLYQKIQMGALVAILAAVVGAWASR